MEEEKKKFHKFLNFILFVIILSLGIVFYSKYVGVKGLIVKEYRIESNILTKNFSGLKIVHFSDLLYKSTVDRDDIKKLINKIKKVLELQSYSSLDMISDISNIIKLISDKNDYICVSVYNNVNNDFEMDTTSFDDAIKEQSLKLELN